MVFQSSAFELTRRIQHWHGGDEWAAMEEVAQAHDPAQADPERGWIGGRIFKCKTCEEQIRVVDPADPTAER